MNKENKTPNNFCETPAEKCTMNYCDENGCQNSKRHLVAGNKPPTAEQKFDFALKALRLEVDSYIVESLQELKDDAFKSLKAENERLKVENFKLQTLIDSKYRGRFNELVAENEGLKMKANQNEGLINDNLKFIDENQKLREALDSALTFIDELKKHGITNWSGEAAVKEVLKGGGDD